MSLNAPIMRCIICAVAIAAICSTIFSATILQSADRLCFEQLAIAAGKLLPQDPQAVAPISVLDTEAPGAFGPALFTLLFVAVLGTYLGYQITSTGRLVVAAVMVIMVIAYTALIGGWNLATGHPLELSLCSLLSVAAGAWIKRDDEREREEPS